MILKIKYLLFIVCTFFVSTHIFGQLKADFSASATSGCLPLPIALTDKSTGNPDRWVWEVGDGRIFNLPNPSFVYLLPGAYTIKLTVFKGLLDSATITKVAHINVHDYPKVNFSSINLEGCIPYPVTFSNLSLPGSGTLSSFLWDFGDGSIGTDKDPMHTYKISGVYKVTLSVKNSVGCESSFTIPDFIKILDSVKANFNYRVIPSCGAPFPVAFTDTSIGKGVTEWNWDFGDGKTSVEKNPIHNYTAPGTYKIRLIAKNVVGCSDTITKTVSILLNNFQVSFNAPDQACRGPLVKFTNTSNPISQVDSVRWDFGDGSFSKAISPEKGFATPGTFTVKLTSYFGTCSLTASKNITINPGPTTQFSGAPLIACKPPHRVNFRNETINGTVLRWNFGNGIRTPTVNPSAIYDSVGTYDVSLITINSAGCLDTLTMPKYVKVQPPHISNIPGLPYEGCFPWTHRFRPVISSSDPIQKWEWDFGDGRTSNEENPVITFSVTGNYQVKLKITTESGCVDSIVTTVKGGQKPIINFSATPLVVCPSKPVFFNGTIVGTYDSFIWEFGDGGKNKISLSPEYLYKDTGFMDVTLFVYNNGCYDSLLIKKYIYVNPPISKFSDSFNCTNQFVRYFTDSSYGALYWNWDFGNGETSNLRNPTHTYLSPGTYNVTLTVSDDLCEHRSSKTIHIYDEKPDYVISPASTCGDNIVTITAQGPNFNASNIGAYLWRFSDAVNYSREGPTIQRRFTQNANLTLRLYTTDLNGCQRTIIKPFTVSIDGPKAKIVPPFTFACVGNKVVFADSSVRSSANPIIKWTWNFGNGPDQIFSAPPFETVYNDTGYYDLKLKVEDINGCIDSISIPRGVGVFNPKAHFSSPDTIICPNTNVGFINASTGIGLKYKWELGEGDFSNLQVPLKVFRNPGRYDISLEVTDTANCVSTLKLPEYIFVGGANADFEVSDSFASCPPLRVSFKNKSVGAISSQWIFGNGNTSSLDNPVQTYTDLGTFNPMLIITGNGGCTDTLVKQIRIQGPTGTITYGPLSGCPPVEVQFSSNTKNVKTYIWDFSDGVTEFTSDSTIKHTYLNPGTYRPRVILEDGQSCRISIFGSEDIKIVGVRSFIKELPDYVYCDSVTIAFQDSSITNDQIKRWKWDFGDGDTSALANPKHTFNKPGRYTVSLYVETFDNCNSISTLPGEVVIASSPRIAMDMDTSFCLPGELLFSANQLNNDTTNLEWYWDFGNGITSQKEFPDSVLYDKKGIYYPFVMVRDNYGCQDSTSSKITVDEKAEIYIRNIGNNQFCNTGTVAFQDSAVNASVINKWNWDFGDGSFSNDKNPVHTYTKVGRYEVTLNVETDRNCVSSYILPGEIIIAPSPTMLIGTDTAVCSPGNIIFSSNPANPDTLGVTYHWDFGNGTTSKEQNPGNVLYNNKGTYRVSLNTVNSYGCRDSAFRIINVNEKPNVVLADLSIMEFCDSARINFRENVISTDPIVSRIWNFGDGTTSTLQNPVHEFKKAGRYFVSLEVVTTNNCVNNNTFSKPIIISESPKISTGSDTTFCIPENIYLSAQWNNPDTSRLVWRWELGNGTTSDMQVPGLLMYKTPGTFITRVTATNEYGCTDNMVRQIIANDTPKISVSGGQLICRNASTQLVANGANQFIWDAQSSLSCINCPNPTATPLSSTTYRVTGSNGTGIGCERSKEILVKVIEPLRVSASRGDSLCIGESYQLSASGGDVYVWHPETGLSATNIPNPLARPQQTTNYRLLVSDSLNCFRDTLYVPIVVFPVPEIKILEKKITGIVGTRVVINTESKNVTRWRWNPAIGLSCAGCPQPELNITQPITYRVLATNPGGCESKDEVVIEPICSAEDIFMPNTFSPNGDGRNDLFYPMGQGVSAIKSLRIFNRWGEMVFERSNLNANDPSAGWDGTYKGRPLNPDVYVYILVVLCYNNETLDIKGNVTLLK